MPVYEYKGQFYELSETDSAAAKAKILQHLGTSQIAPPVQAPQKALVQTEQISPDMGATDPFMTGIASAISAEPGAVTQTRPSGYQSVLEKYNIEQAGKQIPFTPEEGAALSNLKNIQRTQAQVAQGREIQARQQAARQAQREAAQAEDYGITDFLKDTGVDLAKGVVGLGEAYIGLLNLTSGGAAGRVLGDLGYDPERTKKFLTGFQSLTRQEADRSVQEASGFLDTLGALGVNPTALIGTVAESLPGTVLSGGAGGQFVRFLAGKAATEATALGLTGSAAEKFITDRIKDQTFKIAAVASGTEGLQAAGSIAEAARQSGREYSDYILPALGAGFGTTAIGVVGGKIGAKMGVGDIETSIATRSAGIRGATPTKGPVFTRILKEAAKEGVFEEMPQSAQEQVFQNLALGRPWDEGVDKAAAMGLVAGLAMGGGNASVVAALRGGASSSDVRNATPERIEPTFEERPPAAEAPAPVEPSPPTAPPPTAAPPNIGRMQEQQRAAEEMEQAMETSAAPPVAEAPVAEPPVAPGKERISVKDLIAESTPVGVNERGEQLFDNKQGRFRVRLDRAEYGKDGYADFGGDLAPTEQKTVATEAPAPTQPAESRGLVAPPQAELPPLPEAAPPVEPPAAQEALKALAEEEILPPVNVPGANNTNKALADAFEDNDWNLVTNQLQRSKNPLISAIGKMAENLIIPTQINPKVFLRRPRSVKAGYSRHTGVIYARSKIAAASEHFIAHETVHAMTINAIRNPTDKQKSAVNRLNNLYEYVKKRLGKDGKQRYGLTKIEEFIAEGNSNADFQRELARIPYQRQTAWGAFTKTIADLLDIKDSRALTELIALTEELSGAIPQQLTQETPTQAAPVSTKSRLPDIVVPAGFKPKKGRNPQLVFAARALAEGKITKDQYDEYVERYNPIKEVLGGDIELPIEDAMMTRILTKEIKDKKKPELVNAPINNGTRVGLRMDIPALEWGRQNGVNGSVVSIHEGSDPKKKTQGENISYKSTGRIKNVVFAPRSEEDAFKIAQQAEPEVRTKKTGEQYLKEVADKKPQQTIEGDWVNTSPEETLRLVQEHFNDPNWVQVSLDPLRHSFFYARDSKRPVLSADEALQIGRFVLVKNPVYGDRQQFLYSLEPALNTPVTGDPAKRNPSFKREVAKLNKQREQGYITDEEFARRIDELIAADDRRRIEKDIADLGKGRTRGADYIRQRLLEAKRRGDLSPEAVDLAEWLITNNPQLVEDLGIAIKTPKEGGVVGMYNALTRIIILMKERGSDNTIVHEILHHLERMMPANVQSAIRREWTKQFLKAQKNAKTPAEQLYFNALATHNFDNQRMSFDSVPAELRKLYTDVLRDMGIDGERVDGSMLARNLLTSGLVNIGLYQYYNPSEFWAVNGSDIVRGRYDAVRGGVLARLKNWLRELGQKIKSVFGLASDAPIIRALDSLAKSDGKFVSQDLLDQAKTMFSIEPTGEPSEGREITPSRVGKNIYNERPLAEWTRPIDTKLDEAIYYISDKQIDTKRVVQEIERAVGRLEDRWDPYLQEELYHGRTATATKNFLRSEVIPLLEGMQKEGVTIDELNTYLHNRFAPIRNENIANINPNMPDAGSGILTEDAQAYMDALTPEQKTKYERIAAKVDAITQGTRDYLIGSGLESQDVINSWESSSPFYVPLNREDVEYTSSGGMGTGRGFSVSGPSSKRAFGSLREVSDILANIIMQRERALVRGEKNRVGVAAYGLAAQNPNPDFWLAVNPDATKNREQMINELINMGLTEEAAQGLMQEPKKLGLDPQTGLVVSRINIPDRYRDNVLGLRINGKDRFIFFNSRDPRAQRMITALKNLDADQLGRLLTNIAMVTRYFSQINTQYNPVFGIYNFLRDIQGAAVQLSGTEIEDRRADVLSPKNIVGSLNGIYSTLRAERANNPQLMTPWSELWIEFQREGGQTGYRDLFSRSQERANALKAELDKLQESGGRKAALAVPRAIFGWLSDYNETLENAVRLTAYKAALDKGLSKERAASIAKNLTVNFNRKGQIGTQAGALYSFFNSGVQGTTRMVGTIAKLERPGDIKSLSLSKIGKKIVYGGLLLGSIQAMLLAAAGFDETEPPDFVKDRNLIIPIGEGKYLAWPYPLGYHVIPAISRIITEWGISGLKDTPKRVLHLADLLLDAFNPIGNAGWSLQTLAPTIFDPLAALFENKDWTGKKIAKEDFNKLDPTPGYTRAKENASWLSKEISYYLNAISGGDKDKPGALSPTPDQIDYLIGQATGGLGRETMKGAKTAEATITGEELPPYNIPLVGRFFGNTKAGYAEAQRFYKNLEELNILENQLEGRTKRKEDPAQFKKDNPKVALADDAQRTYNLIRKIRKERDELIKKGAEREAIQAKEQRMVNLMRRINNKVSAYDKGKPQKEEQEETKP